MAEVLKPARVGEYDDESGDAVEALRQANDIERLLRELARKQRWSETDLEGLKTHLLAMTPEDLTGWERGYRQHVDVPSNGALTEDEQALVDQYNGYDEAAEILRIVRGSAPVRAGDAVPPQPGPRRMEDDGGISFRDVTVYQNPDGTFKIIETASNTVIDAAAPENFEREFTGRKGPERMRLVMRRGRPYWERVSAAAPVASSVPAAPRDEAAATRERIDELEKQLREVRAAGSRADARGIPREAAEPRVRWKMLPPKMGREIRVSEGDERRYEIRQSAGWEPLVDEARYKVRRGEERGTAAWEADFADFKDFRPETAAAATPSAPPEAAPAVDTAEAQLRDIFGENAAQIRTSLERAYAGYDPDVVNELLRVELAAVGVVDSHDVLTAVGGLRDITGTTTDRWPDARERAYLKELMQNKRGLARVLRELSLTLGRWKKIEDAEWVRLYVAAVTEHVKQGRLSRMLRGPAINPVELEKGLTSMLQLTNQDKPQMRRWLRRTALRGVSDKFLDEVVDDIHRYMHGDDTVEESRAYGMRRHVRYHAESIQESRGRRR